MKPLRLIRLVLITLGGIIALGLPSGCGSDPEPSMVVKQASDASPCVHLQLGTNSFSLNYFGYVCPHKGFPPLPAAQFDDFANWAFNTSHYGLLSPLNRYRIYARLATLDDREQHGNGHAGSYYEIAEWAKDTEQAFAGLLDAKCPAPITAGLETSLVDVELARRQLGISWLIVGNSRAGAHPLTPSKKQKLVAAFIETEARLLNEGSLDIVPKRLDEVAREGNPSSEIEAARRHNLGKFTLVE
jgi:hypothetical protein